MTDPSERDTPRYLLRDPRPWAFSRSELMAGLRRTTGDPRLQLEAVEAYDIPQLRPSIGRIRGLQVTCRGESGEHTFNLVLKEPLGTTRTGTAGVGLREVSLYRILGEQLPVRTPRLLAAHPVGDWLVMDLLPPGRPPETWTSSDYHLALDNLISLHDRFWGLGGDLTVYNWLARPLDADFDIYIQAAASGVGHLVDDPPPALFARDPDLAQLLGRLVVHADQIAGAMQGEPTTLIHGDYWPGNLHIDEQDQLTTFDWQQAGIGPCVLDLVTFVQASRWWFDPLPVAVDDLIRYYQERLAEANGYRWQGDEWERLWDYALLWIFIAHWIDLVVAIPASLVDTRLESFNKVWLEPLQAAASRRDIPAA